MNNGCGKGGVGERSRREFLRSSAAVAVGASLAGGLSIARCAHAAGDDVLKVGVIGCGGRGTGAAVNAMNVGKDVKLTAMADVFADRLEASLQRLKKVKGNQVAVDDDHCFVGFDAYQKVIQSGVDVVILTAVPHFRPKHLKACVDAGKHVFCEKPVAVDAPGVRSVLASTEEAKKKNLSIVSGLCSRYDYGIRETVKRVHDGAIGHIVAIQGTRNGGFIWYRERKPEWTEMEYQLRNWHYFTWLSGDINAEMFVHQLDLAAWAMREEPPLRTWGLGGRQVRTDPKFGQIFDHHAEVYEYADGIRLYAYNRQQGGCYNESSVLILGTKGRCNIIKNQIEGETNWRYEGPKVNMFDVEHQELFAAIRSGKPINNGLHMARSTMVAILGRMVDYTGQVITWERALGSKQDLSPERYSFDADPPTKPGPDGRYPVAMPGITKFV